MGRYWNENNVPVSRQQVWDPNTEGYRLENDTEYYNRIQDVPIRDMQLNGGPASAFQSYSPNEEENAFVEDYIARQKLAAGLGQDVARRQGAVPETYANANFLPSEQELQLWRSQNPVMQKSVGPETPQWATAFNIPNQNVQVSKGNWQNQLNLNRLKNWRINPVSQQAWASLASSEREGLGGLVGATGQSWQDYIDDSQSSWAKPGYSVARRQTPRYW
jgi:hypothetical protein